MLICGCCGKEFESLCRDGEDDEIGFCVKCLYGECDCKKSKKGGKR